MRDAGIILQMIFPGKRLENMVRASGIGISHQKLTTILQWMVTLDGILLFILMLTGFGVVNSLLVTAMILAMIVSIPWSLMLAKIRRRNQLFQREMANLIDMLGMCVTAGMNIDESFSYVATKLKNSIGETLRRYEILRKMGLPFEEYLMKLRESIIIPEFQHLTESLIQGRKLGVSIVQTLEIQSDLIRTRRKQKAEELSRTATVKITLPLVFCIFPALLIIFIGPGILQLIGK